MKTIANNKDFIISVYGAENNHRIEVINKKENIISLYEGSYYINDYASKFKDVGGMLSYIGTKAELLDNYIGYPFKVEGSLDKKSTKELQKIKTCILTQLNDYIADRLVYDNVRLENNEIRVYISVKVDTGYYLERIKNQLVGCIKLK